jgi:osmotically-inducible protein OsmY
MRKYGKWVLTLGLLAATPGMTLAAGFMSKAEEKPAADSKAKAGESQKANEKVANEVAKAMKAKRVQGENISISVKQGVATISGTVADEKSREKAHEAARSVASVSRVENRLQVAQAARPAAKAPAAEAAAAGGVVSANHTASGANGNRVQQVNSEFATPPSANQEVAEQIGAALTEAHLDGYDIQIRYQNGVALLDGSVGTQAERATASQVVQQIPGVRSVANRLQCSREPAAAAAPQGQPGQPQMYPVGYRQPMPGGPGMPPQGMAPQGAMPMGPGGPPMPPTYGHPGAGASQAVFNNPSVPDYAWPSYAQYPNVAAVNYPTQYSASAWPYIGPFYPYPQVPMGWRDATLRWDDGQWNLMFRTRTDKWWWYFNPNNW